MPLTITDVAAICHEANRQLCKRQTDFTQLPWYSAPEWAKESAIAGVKAILVNPDTTPEKSHENWLAYKEADGWRYGVMKNSFTKEHPCIVPYDELPDDQKLKDHLFLGIVNAAKPFITPPDEDSDLEA